MKRFYIGAKHIAAAISKKQNADCMRLHYDEAVEEARGMIRRGEVESCVIVKVVAIVRKEYPPIIVEHMKDDDDLSPSATWDITRDGPPNDRR